MDAPRLSFPTFVGPPSSGQQLGFPDRAKPCRGHRCVIHDTECVWCGRLPEGEIAATWARRALALDRAARAPAPFGRFVYRLGGGMAPV